MFRAFQDTRHEQFMNIIKTGTNDEIHSYLMDMVIGQQGSWRKFKDNMRVYIPEIVSLLREAEPQRQGVLIEALIKLGRTEASQNTLLDGGIIPIVASWLQGDARGLKKEAIWALSEMIEYSDPRLKPDVLLGNQQEYATPIKNQRVLNAIRDSGLIPLIRAFYIEDVERYSRERADSDESVRTSSSDTVTDLAVKLLEALGEPIPEIAHGNQNAIAFGQESKAAYDEPGNRL
ncbi:MAG: hypothetical protein K0S29_935 [Gammaproteobacteria bacterium]|jgi:hypothetical protein|nr:hypothetical protein [Gammaproteobacteria bacterium]